MAATGGCGDSECGEAAARVTDLCGVGRGECTARAAGGDDVDGEGGGEAATGWTITDEAASVLEACVRAAGERGSWRGGLRNFCHRYSVAECGGTQPKRCKSVEYILVSTRTS